MIPLKINGHNLCEILEPDVDFSNYTEEEIINYSIAHRMFPTNVKLDAETYCRDSDRTSDFELENITNINAKAKPAFTWDYLKAIYVERLLVFCGFKYNYKVNGIIVPEEAPTLTITYLDFIGLRSISAYLGQNLEGELTEIQEFDELNMVPEKVLYWQNFRIAFPER